MKIRATGARAPHDDLLKRAYELADQVRRTAERVHRAAVEAQHLAESARRHAQRGRELSRAGRAEAVSTRHSTGWTLDLIRNSDRRPRRDGNGG